VQSTLIGFYHKVTHHFNFAIPGESTISP